MKKAVSFLASILILSSFTQAQILTPDDGISIGYQFSHPSFSTISYDRGLLKTEARIMVNNPNAYDADFELMAGVYYLRYEDIKLYAGLGARLQRNYPSRVMLTVPIGAVVHPFTNKRLGLVMELSPAMGEQDYFGRSSRTYVRGSFGVRFSVTKENRGASHFSDAPKDTLVINFRRGYYVTLGGPSASVGIQYSWFTNNFDWHLGVTALIPSGIYGGLYYHFVRKHSSSNFHLYAGADAGGGFFLGYGSELIPTLYFPVGLQYINARGFTASLEAAGFLTPDGYYTPWAGVKIGRTLMKE